MIGQLLKQLPSALYRYLRYKLFGAGPAAGSVHAPAPSPAPPVKVDAWLDPAYQQSIAWPTYRQDTPPEEVSSLQLYQLWASITGGQKWSHYFESYEAVFGARKGAPLRILEIGVYLGGGLKLWRSYFENPHTIIVGIDIESRCAMYDSPSNGIHVRIGSQADQKFLNKVVEEFGPFDIIIDDGSHVSSHIITSFNCLFENGLRDDGIYFVEDLHAVFWKRWNDSIRNFFDLCAELIQLMHAHYRIVDESAFFLAKPSDSSIPSLVVPRIATMLKEIRMFDSMAAVYKARRAYVPYIVRTDM